MELKVFFPVFAAVFIAELGDKTQLAAMLFATAIGVIAGTLLSEFINEKYLNYLAGAGFRLIGAFTLVPA